MNMNAKNASAKNASGNNAPAKHTSNNLSKAKYAAKIGILAALATVIMLLEFPLTFVAPSFYKLDLSESVILIGGFAMGPLAALIIELLKNILNLIITNTTTVGIGELSNFLVGCAFTVPAAIVYKYKKTQKGAIISLITGTTALCILSTLVNYYIIIPAYATVGFPMEEIIETGTKIFPWVKDLLTFVLSCTLPFNLIKGLVCSLICFLLYKRVSPILHM